MKESEFQKGHLFVITAPSGTGKSTIIEMLRGNLGEVYYSISHTTRAPREGEVNGVHYHFVSRQAFEKMIQAGEFIEWAVVYDQLYGTSTSAVESALSSGKDILLDLDIQGALEVKRQFSESTLIFIFPPSLEVLKERLQNRSMHDDTNIELRMKRAEEEISKCKDYDFLIVNNALEQSVKEVEAIIISQRARTKRRLPFFQKIFHL
jgi:guanylate kinase